MAKCFLSHSSKDKKKYVELVAKKLGIERCIYDEFTFESGMQPIEEIVKGLDSTDLFVIFISEDALNSDWVKTEITRANKLYLEGYINRIFPIIIDRSITYQDERIPDWLRDEYNLKYISQPTGAVRRIGQRLREIGWHSHSKVKARQKIFVGRNDIIKSFEERIDDYDKSSPVCVLASGLPEIGRRTLLKHCCIKSDLVSESYDFLVINLSRQEGIDDFIYKIYDLSMSSGQDLTGSMSKSVEEKISIATDLCMDLQQARERVLIIDDRCIVTGSGELVDWFDSILGSIKHEERLTFLVASRSRASVHKLRKIDHVYAIGVPELSRKERRGLLKRYAKLEGLDIGGDDLEFFSQRLSGYPAQVFYAVDLIKDKGLFRAKRDVSSIVEFGESKVQRILGRYEGEQKKLEVIYLLSEFDFISYEFAYEIVADDAFFDQLIEELLTSSICELLGANGEYIRVNDAVGDHVRRMRHSLPVRYRKRLTEHVNRFLETYKEEDKDISDYFYSLKRALIDGKEISDAHLIPSHFLKTIKELYDRHKKYPDVVRLSNRVLQNEFSLDEGIKNNVRYYLCLSLARLRDKEQFLSEVHKIHGPEHNFLMGFFYRLQGSPEKAKERLEEAMDNPKTAVRASREMVQVLIDLEDFDRALDLSEHNYEKYPESPFHVHAYAKSLLSSKSEVDEDKFKTLLEKLQASVATPGIEMYIEMKARYMATHKGMYEEALAELDEGVGKYKSSIHLLIARFDISRDFGAEAEMARSVELMAKEIDADSSFFRQLIKAKCTLLAKKGDKKGAISLLKKSLDGYPSSYIDRWAARLSSMS